MHPPPQRELEPRERGRSPLRTALTMLVLTGLVVLAGWYAWGVVTEPSGEDDAADEPVARGPVCVVAVPTDPPDPEEISVYVYNGTTRSGLASQVARELRGDGFIILDVANEPRGRTITGVAEIRASDETSPEVRYVMSQFPGAVFVPHERDDDTIDVVLGDAFVEVGPLDEVTADEEGDEDGEDTEPHPAAGLPDC